MYAGALALHTVGNGNVVLAHKGLVQLNIHFRGIRAVVDTVHNIVGVGVVLRMVPRVTEEVWRHAGIAPTALHLPMHVGAASCDPFSLLTCVEESMTCAALSVSALLLSAVSRGS